MIDIRTLRAAGLTETQILRVVEEDQAKRREQNRKAQQKHRACQHDIADRADTPLTVLPSSINNLKVQEERLEIVALAPAPKNRRRPLPDDWEPIGEQRDPAEADEFRDHARAKGYQYIDWHAAYRNFQRSPYNPRNKPGAPQPGIAEAERVVMLEEFHRAQLNRRNANVQTTEKSRPDHAG